MKYYIFERSSNDFSDIEEDANIKPYIKYRVRCTRLFYFGIPEKHNDKLQSYIMLKYGDDYRASICKDRTPIEGVDYVSKQRPATWK